MLAGHQMVQYPRYLALDHLLIDRAKSDHANPRAGGMQNKALELDTTVVLKMNRRNRYRRHTRSFSAAISLR